MEIFVDLCTLIYSTTSLLLGRGTVELIMARCYVPFIIFMCIHETLNFNTKYYCFILQLMTIKFNFIQALSTVLW